LPDAAPANCDSLSSIYRILSLESLLLYHLINHQHIFNMRTAGLLVAALAATASVDAGVHR